jgi:hypothetical protein
MRRISGRPSPAMAVAFIALLAALSGTAVALPGKNTVDSGDLKKNAVKTRDIARNAVTTPKIRNGAVNSRKVRNNSLTGTDINESTLGQVPSANTANHANTATNADKVDGRDAEQLDSNGFIAISDGNVNLPAGANTTTVSTLNVPAGSYMIFARGGVNNNGGASDNQVSCTLAAGATTQVVDNFFLGANVTVNDTEMASWQIAHSFGAPEAITLSCTTTAGWGGGNFMDPTISAISVASIG